MKRNVYVVLVGVMVLFQTTVAFAQNAGEQSDDVLIDEETREELEIMNNYYGATIRLLQLEQAVVCNLDTGNALVSLLSDFDVDTLELEAILAEMQLLVQEIQAVDPNASEVSYLFVELKKDAMNLSTEFRDLLHSLLDPATLEVVREAVHNHSCDQALEIGEQIRRRIKAFNEQQLHTIVPLLGITNDSFVQGYHNGTLSLAHVKQRLSATVHALGEGEQFGLYTELKEDHLHVRIQVRGALNNLTDQYYQRQCLRIRNRLNSTDSIENETVRLALQQRMQNRLHRSENATGPGGNGQGPGGNGTCDGSGGQGDQGSGDGCGEGSGDGSGGGNGHQNGPGGGGGP